jgi:hypothetical protein
MPPGSAHGVREARRVPTRRRGVRAPGCPGGWRIPRPDDAGRAEGFGPIDGDLDVTCVPGAIIIRESDVLDRLPDGLREIFRSFGIHPDTVREVMKKEGYFA